MLTRSWRTSVLPVAVLAALLAGGGVGASSFDLRVNDVSGLDEPWPLIGGLPFPEGELHEASRIRIVDGEGQEVPAQIDVAATWRDGSIRWALAGFTASPQGTYRVEYGPGVNRKRPAVPLTVDADEAGNVTVDTGAAVYEFVEDRLLPETGRMGESVFLAGAGDGAYVVDNKGRLARVAGAEAEISNEIVKQGPGRAVVRRDGWYVTSDGECVARAEAWFYFQANSPYVKVTHTLVLTRDTNELWIRDYGLELNTPRPPGEVAFALSNPAPKESLSWREARDLPEEQAREDLSKLFSGMHGREWRLYTTDPAGDEVYMLQDDYAHHFEREFRAVIGRVAPGEGQTMLRGDTAAENLWLQDWEKETEVAGDWADGRYGGEGLTVVMPWLAQRFPKEIAFGPQGARLAFWSGRSGRELDFRPVTLVNEYWKRWAEASAPGADYSSEAATELAAESTNAQCAARTHDVWLLPRTETVEEEKLKARATAAARTPLVMADPQWLTATEAIGLPMHPKDEERFPQAEKVISDYWDGLMQRRSGLRRTGFIEWGLTPYIRNPNQHFRVSRLVDYGLRRHAWQLYARSGERRYWEYASRFNRFAGDWELAHWTAGDKRKGEFVDGDINRPFHWGSSTEMWGGVTGHGITNWLLEYYLTGDEYALNLTRMHGEACKKRWDPDEVANIVRSKDGVYANLGVFADLYRREWDEEFRRMGRLLADQLIDLDNPTGRWDEARFGVLYKGHRAIFNLYDYYRATGHEAAKEAFLKTMAHDYRFHRFGGAFSGQNYSAMLFTIAYRWTGRSAYQRVVHDLVEQHRQGSSRRQVHLQIHPLGAIPAALGLMAEVEEEAIEPFPVIETDDPRPIDFCKRAGEPVNLSIFVRMSDDVAEDAETLVQITPEGDDEALKNVCVQVERMFPTKYDGRRDVRRRHVDLTIPAAAPAGQYTLRLPDTMRIVVLESDAPKIALADHGNE